MAVRGIAIATGEVYPSPTFTGTVTFPDTSTWNAAGVTIVGIMNAAGQAKFTGTMGSPASNGQAFIGGESAYGFRFTGKGSAFDCAFYNSAGSAVFVVPTGTTTFQCTGALEVSSAVLIKSNTTLSDGAAAQVGTLTNAPTAGNPTKWIPINDNGTTRYFPAW